MDGERSRSLNGLRHVVVIVVSLLVPLLGAGCSSSNPSASAANGTRYIVTADSTSFFKYGPAQQGGADYILQKGRQVELVERHYGFSRVRTDDGDTGYVPTDDLSPAPEEPRLAVVQPKKSTSGSRSRGGGSSQVIDQPNEAALPSAQPGSDVPAPSFRY